MIETEKTQIIQPAETAARSAPRPRQPATLEDEIFGMTRPSAKDEERSNLMIGAHVSEVTGMWRRRNLRK